MRYKRFVNNLRPFNRSISISFGSTPTQRQTSYAKLLEMRVNTTGENRLRNAAELATSFDVRVEIILPRRGQVRYTPTVALCFDWDLYELAD